jgi:hypothetical protein
MYARPLSLAPGSVVRRHRTGGLTIYPRALLVGIALVVLGDVR